MNRYRLSWFRIHWKLLAGILVLLSSGVIVIGILTWNRSAEESATNHSAADSAKKNPIAPKNTALAVTKAAPKQLLSRYSLPVTTLAFSPDGQRLAMAADNPRGRREIRLWDLISAREERVCRDFPYAVVALAFSADGKTLTVGGQGTLRIPGNNGSGSGEIKLWDTETDAKPSLWLKTERPIVSMTLSPQADKLAVGCEDGTLTLYNKATQQPERSFRGQRGLNPFTNIAFSADGKKIAWGGVASSGGATPRDWAILQVWDAVGDKLLATLHPPEGRPNIPHTNYVAFLPGGVKLISSSNQSIYIWDLNSGQIEASLTGHQGTIDAIALSSDGRLLASADSYACIKLWDVAARRQKTTLRPPTIIVQSLRSPDQKQSRTVALAFAPDGEILASSTLFSGAGGEEGIVELWDLIALKKVDLAH